MSKHLCVIVLILWPFIAFGQEDTLIKAGTIRIGKQKKDSVYVKANVLFSEFREGRKKVKGLQPGLPSRAIAPVPKYNGVSGFSLNLFFNKRVKIDLGDLAGRTTDTVRIQVKVLDNGKPYYKDLTPLLVLNGVPAVFDKKENAYKLDAIHYKCLNAAKSIEEWEPGYVLLEKVDKFKGQTVIKAKKKKIISIGVLTIVFSTIPFESLENK